MKNAVSPLLLALILLSSCEKKQVENSALFTQKTEEKQGLSFFKQDALMEQFAIWILQENLELKSTKARLEQADALVRVANAGFFPDLSIAGSFTRGNDKFGQKIPGSIARGGFETAWELDLFRKTRSEAKGALYQKRAVEASVEELKNLLIAQSFKELTNWRQLCQTRAAMQNQLSLQKEKILLLSDQHAAGLIDQIAVENAKAAIFQQTAALTQIEAQIDVLQYKLAHLTCKKIEEIQIALGQDSQELHLKEPSTLFKMSLETIENRPDVRYFKNSLLSQQAQSAKAQADRFPSLSLGAFFGVQKGSNTVPLATNPVWSFTSGITAPLLNFGRLKGLASAAEARADAAQFEYENAISTALEEMQTALSDYLNGLNASTQKEALLQSRIVSLNLAKEQFEGGLTDKLTLLAAQIESEAAFIELLKEKAQTIIAYIRLQKAIASPFYSFD